MNKLKRKLACIESDKQSNYLSKQSGECHYQ